jgi:hypothetical protein
MLSLLCKLILPEARKPNRQARFAKLCAAAFKQKLKFSLLALQPSNCSLPPSTLLSDMPRHFSPLLGVQHFSIRFGSSLCSAQKSAYTCRRFLRLTGFCVRKGQFGASQKESAGRGVVRKALTIRLIACAVGLACLNV